MSEADTDLITMTADIVSAYVSKNEIATADVATLIASIHSALAEALSPATPEAPKQEPAVPIKSSIKNDYIVSLESGKKMKMLKRYLMTQYQMTPADYRSKWGLPHDYPMVAPAYAAMRGEFAKSSGLGKKAGTTVKDAVVHATEAVVETATPKKRGRPAKAAADAPASKPAKSKPKGIAEAKAAAAAHLAGGEPTEN
ncbi:MucR family transcriptional regulator [uncultured Sphingomonas sp.]|uniref:MucR family transcriptional regulator n=1 Tax=uncultured Sphingomonas sp. TaxID=158754 RepID=UPI002607DFD4|nr:MucR family transcriptional regulator [uncultured Sphingomonas sp.]